MAEVVRCTEAGGKFYVFTAYAGDGGVRIPCMYSDRASSKKIGAVNSIMILSDL